MALQHWKTRSSHYLVKDRWMTVRVDSCETSRGTIVEPYYVQESSDWAHVIAFSPANELLIIKQYRHALGRIVYELPCGVVEEGECPLESAKRELLEETGCTSENWKELPPLSPNPARLTNLTRGFIATDTVVSTTQKLEACEDIEFEFMPIARVLTLIEDGKFGGAIHGCGIFQALLFRNLLKPEF